MVDDRTRTIRGMHVYDSIIVFDKGDVPPPTHEKAGTPLVLTDPVCALGPLSRRRR